MVSLGVHWLEYMHFLIFPGLNRCHMLSIVSIDGQDYHVDVGFGK